MTDLLVAVADGETRFDPERIVDVVVRRWPSVGWGDPDEELAATLAKQVTIQYDQQVLIVDVLAGHEGIGVEGDDDLAAEFLALLTQSMPIPEDEIVVMNWTDQIVALRSGMTPDDVRALRA